MIDFPSSCPGSVFNDARATALVFLLLYVDDILIISRSLGMIDAIKKIMKK